MSRTEKVDAQKKPLMLIGPVAAGKSTLIKALGMDDGPEEAKGEKAKKTEAITYFSQAIDTPGEMITIPFFYNALIVNSVRARMILLLMDGQKPSHLPPRLALALKAPVIGVINKIDQASESNLAKAWAALQGAGVREIFKISAVTGEGIAQLRELIEKN